MEKSIFKEWPVLAVLVLRARERAIMDDDVAYLQSTVGT